MKHEKVPVYGIRDFKETREEELAFYSNTLRKHLDSHKFINDPHSHKFYITILFTSGTGTHDIDFERYKIKTPCVFIMQPGQIHCWNLSADTNGYIFFHSKEFYDSHFRNHSLDAFPFFFTSKAYPFISLDEAGNKKIKNLFQEIHSEYTTENRFTEFKLACLLGLTYGALEECYKRKSLPSENEYQVRTRTLLKLIDTHFRTHKKPQDYADMLNMSTRHLSRICHETLNTNPSELISERIILEAKRLLIHSPSAINEVAYELGFEDAGYFNRIFKQKTGMTPKEFRRQRSGDRDQ